MPVYYVQQQHISNNSRTVVKDDRQNALYLMVGRWGGRGDALSLYTMSGDIVASIKQVSLTPGSRFDLYEGYEKVGTLRRYLSIQRDFYFIHQLKWSVIGDIKNHHYSIYQMNHRIMTMEKAYLATGDFYALDVKQTTDAPLCICIAAVLDYWLIDRKKNWLPWKKMPINYSVE